MSINRYPTVGTKWRTNISRPRRVVGVIDGAVVIRLIDNGYPTVDTLDWWRENAIIIPDPPKITAGYRAVWDGGDLGVNHDTADGAWRNVDKWEAVGVVEVIPDDHGGARLVPVDRDGRRTGSES